MTAAEFAAEVKIPPIVFSSSDNFLKFFLYLIKTFYFNSRVFYFE